MTPTPEHVPTPDNDPAVDPATFVGPDASLEPDASVEPSDTRADKDGSTRPSWLRLGAVGALAAGVLLAGTLVQGDVRLPGAGDPGIDGASATQAPGAGDATGGSGAAAPPPAVTASALGCGGAAPAASAEGGAAADGDTGDEAAATEQPSSDDGATGGGSPDSGAVTVVASRVPAALTESLSELSAQGRAEITLSGSEENTPLEEGPLAQSVASEVAALVTGEGSAAPGLVAGQLGLADRPADRWLALTACTPPAEEQWLLGGGDAAGRTEEIVLTNPGPDAATVDVEVWGADGAATATGSAGIVVPGHGRVTRLLDALAPGTKAPVVRVTATGSPVSAHLVDQWRDGTTDLGGELTTSASAPTTDLVVPAPPRGPAQDAEVVVRLLAPEEPAVVDLTALTADGAVALAGHVTSLDAGQVQDVTLDDLPEGVLALRVRSTTPVTAAATVALAPTSDEPVDMTDASAAPTETPEDDSAAATAEPLPDEPLVRPGGEFAWAPGALASTTPLGMGLPDRSGVPGADARLTLTAVDATQASVVWVDDEGGARTEDVGQVPNDTTVVLEVPEGARAVWVIPGQGGGLVASVQLVGEDARGPYLSSTTLPALAWQRAVTEVRVLTP